MSLRSRLWLGGSALAVIAAVVVACTMVQAAAPSATLSWTAPTTNTDGTAITPGTLTFNVYQGPMGAETGPAVQAASNPITITAGLTPGATVCFEVTAVSAAGVESAKSNEACKAFAPEVPVAPTNLAVQ